ncbi:MAG: hypothetical protein O3A47_08985 [Chloroflexi bacterium]|nr:hypothetical protein [Chloroflexota bacterium]
MHLAEQGRLGETLPHGGGAESGRPVIPSERSDEESRTVAHRNGRVTSDRFIILAFSDDEPVGLAGLYRDAPNEDFGELT